jgi:hypothetical protein
MTLWFLTCTAVSPRVSLGFVANHMQMGLALGLGSAAFILGTVLRRTRPKRAELAKSQPAGAWEREIAGDARRRGVTSSSGEPVSPQRNPNAA